MGVKGCERRLPPASRGFATLFGRVALLSCRRSDPAGLALCGAGHIVRVVGDSRRAAPVCRRALGPGGWCWGVLVVGGSCGRAVIRRSGTCLVYAASLSRRLVPVVWTSTLPAALIVLRSAPGISARSASFVMRCISGLAVAAGRRRAIVIGGLVSGGLLRRLTAQPLRVQLLLQALEIGGVQR